MLRLCLRYRLLPTACVNLVPRYVARGQTWMAGAAALIAGAAVWYKAIFVIPLAALLAGASAVYFRELRLGGSRRTVLVLLACFAAGIPLWLRSIWRAEAQP
jgi:hypothetical protein